MTKFSVKIGGLLIVVLLFTGQLSMAQNEVNAEMKAIFSLLRSELSRSDPGFMDIPVSEKITENGFVLQLLKAGDQRSYDLDSQPAGSFYLKADKGRVYIASQSVDGLRNGAFWYLHHLGYRYYFPEPVWHFIPQLETVYKPVEKRGIPSFVSRRIWYAYGTDSKKADADYRLWTQANLLGGDEINAGHSYEAIINRNKNEFLKHPEYFAQDVKKGAIPRNPKFEVSNKALVNLCIDDAFAQIESYKKRYGKIPVSISMDPSDGGGFSVRKEALKIGGPSEQVFYLANQVAKAVRLKYPGVLIGLYAYNMHAAPPKFELESNVVVLVATAYNQSIYSLDQLITLWKEKGVKIGIRDYMGVLAWDWDMPGQVKGGKRFYLQQIKDYFKKGALFYSGETNIGWISRGLGHFLGARVLWDVNVDITKEEEEFFKYMFGEAAPEIKTLYEGWEKYKQPVPMDGDIKNWYDLVVSAESKMTDKNSRERVKQLKEYLYFVCLFKDWKKQANDENLVAMLNFAYRIKDRGVVASYPLFRTVANSAVAGKPNMRFNDPAAKWKINDREVSTKELNENLRRKILQLDGRQRAIDTEWPSFLKDKNTAGKSVKNNEAPATISLRGVHKIIFSINQSETPTIYLAAGFIKAKQFKDLTFRIYKYNSDLSLKEEALVMEGKVEPLKPLKKIAIDSLSPGIYIILIDDAAGGFKIGFGGAGYGIVADNQSRLWTLQRSNLFFEVKKGTKEMIVHTDGVLTLTSPTGRVIDLQGKHPETTVVEIKDFEAGVWQMKRQSGRLWIQGPLPIISPVADRLLTSPEINK